MVENRLIEIAKWNMSPEEAKVFKLCLMWEYYTSVLIPTIQVTKLPKKGDPRKSYLFRNCWKLYRETNTLIKDDEYKRYIQAQIEILKDIKSEGVCSHIDAGCLHGEPAWIRWLVWQKKKNEKKFDFTVDPEYIKSEVLRSKVKNYTEEELISGIKKGKISPYLVVLGFDWRAMDLSGKCHLDFKIYEGRITKELKEWFDKLK